MANDTSTNKLIMELSKKIDKFQSNVNSKFEKSDKRFESMDKRFENIDKKFEKIETSLDFVRMDIKGVEEKAEEIDDRNEKRYNKVMNHIDGLAKGFKKFDEEQTMLSSRSTNHTDRIEKLEVNVFGVAQI